MMIKKIFIRTTCAALLLVPSVGIANDSAGFNLRLKIAVQCSVNFQQNNNGISNGAAIPLGNSKEYCNSPRGYQLIVNYTPGTLRGATIFAGDDRVVLNGSGQALLTNSVQPQARSRPISVIPGTDGFNTDRIELNIIPN